MEPRLTLLNFTDNELEGILRDIEYAKTNDGSYPENSTIRKVEDEAVKVYAIERTHVQSIVLREATLEGLRRYIALLNSKQ